MWDTSSQTLLIKLLLFLSFFLFSPFIAAPLVEAGKETDEQNYRLWRIENGVAEGSTEIPKGASYFLLDATLEFLIYPE